MQLLKFLHKTFERSLPRVHKVRLNSLMDAVRSLLSGSDLTLTALGRNMLGQSKERSNIRKMDRLIGNKKLQAESILFYESIAAMLIHPDSSPIIHVDWSCLSSQENLYVLRATLAMPGRSIVLYEQAHPKKHENHHPTHVAFLKTLKSVLPETVQPIIVTDAGFRALWFKAVLSLGWHFVGRLRNKNAVRLKKKSEWVMSKTFYEGASAKGKCLGEYELTRRSQVACTLVSYKGKKAVKKRKHGQTTNDKKYAQANREPWLLATSLKGLNVTKKAIKLYKQRMQIEESFRDTKSDSYGFGLSESGTQTAERMSILLLIGAIAHLICWLAGSAIKQNGEASDFQAHSAKFSNVLSVVYLGRRALRKTLRIPKSRYLELLAHLRNIAISLQADCYV